MAEILCDQVEKRVKNLVVPRTDIRDEFDYGAFDVSSIAVRQSFPWLESLVGDGVLLDDCLARVVLHSAGVGEKVIKTGIWPFNSESKHTIPGFTEISLILPGKGKLTHALGLSWRLVEGEKGKFFLDSAELPVTNDQLQGLNTLLSPKHVQEIRDNHPWFPSPVSSTL